MATVTLVNDQASWTSNSWNTAADWSNTAAPGALNDCVVDGSRILRTVNASSADTFGGNSLTVESGSTLALIGTNNHTITDLRLNGGSVSSLGSASILTLGGGITLGSTSTSTLNASSTSGRTIVVSAAVSGSCNLQASGYLVVLSANNTYSGTTTVNSGGTLQVGNGGATGSISSSSSVITNGTLSYNRSNAHTIGYAISGTGGVSAVGVGATTLNASNAYFGTTTINSGATLQIGNGTTTGSIANTSGVTNGGTLIYNRSDNLSLNYAISGTGTVTKLGAGTLLIDGNNSDATGAVTVAADATLGGIGVVGGSTTIDGFLAPGQSPGTLTFSGNLTLNSGATYLFEGGDLVDVGATHTLADNWTLALGSNLQDGGSIVLLEYGTLGATPDLTPTFDVSSLGFTPTGPLSITTGGGFVTLNGVSLIPEPSSLCLLAMGAFGRLLRRRR